MAFHLQLIYYINFCCAAKSTRSFSLRPPPKKKKLWEAVFNLWMRNQTKKRKLHLLFKPSMIVPFLYLNKKKDNTEKVHRRDGIAPETIDVIAFGNFGNRRFPIMGGWELVVVFWCPPYGSLGRKSWSKFPTKTRKNIKSFGERYSWDFNMLKVFET